MHSSPTGAGSQLATGPWHVMRNGTNAVFSEGEADEVALYTRALSAGEIQNHFALANDLADDPLPGEPTGPAAEPPLSGTGPTGGVLGPGNPLPSPRSPAGIVMVRRGNVDRPRRAKPAQRPRRPQARAQLDRPRPAGAPTGRPRLQAACPTRGEVPPPAA